MISTLIKTWLAPYETYLWAALAVALTLIGAYFVHHERVVGEQKIISADAAAVAREHAQELKYQAALQAASDKAESYRESMQKGLNDYMAAHPVGPVLMCNQSRGSGSAGLPEATPAHSGDAVSGTGPATVPEVPAGIDIGPDLSTIVRAAGTMATLYRQYQQQPEVK
jgi:hypothetical protein